MLVVWIKTTSGNPWRKGILLHEWLFQPGTREEIFYQESDGLINFINKEKIELDFKYGELLKHISLKNNIYSYESDPVNASFWDNFDIKGLIVDINKQKEFEKYANWTRNNNSIYL